VFTVGDVRSGSTKRVASAVGEGAMAVRLVHERDAVRLTDVNGLLAEAWLSGREHGNEARDCG
jgi:hypothetical protein